MQQIPVGQFAPQQAMPPQQAATQYMPPAQPGPAGPSPATKKWLITAAAILAAILLGILVSEMFFV
jgi:hypothetical protein